jgi:thioredoxin reductase (NADPH)
MTGVEFLQNARLLHPEAQWALLVSWGDHKASSTILQGCAFGDPDNYILKPFYPTEVHLYPIIEDFLCQWTRRNGPRGELVRVIGTNALSSQLWTP